MGVLWFARWRRAVSVWSTALGEPMGRNGSDCWAHNVSGEASVAPPANTTMAAMSLRARLGCESLVRLRFMVSRS